MSPMGGYMINSRYTVLFWSVMTVVFTAWGGAAADTFNEFSDNVRKMNTLILEACQKDERSFLNTAGISGDLQNIYNLRRACGQGMSGKTIADSPYQVFFQFDPNADGAVDFLGFNRKRIFGAHTYQMVFGWVTVRAEDSEEAPLESSYAEALLMKKSDFGWLQVWSYVNKSGTDWNRIKVDTPTDYPQFSPGEVTFIHDFWMDAVRGEFPDFMGRIEELAVEN